MKLEVGSYVRASVVVTAWRGDGLITTRIHLYGKIVAYHPPRPTFGGLTPAYFEIAIKNHCNHVCSAKSLIPISKKEFEVAQIMEQ
jgi:hypothetical protein